MLTFTQLVAPKCCYPAGAGTASAGQISARHCRHRYQGANNGNRRFRELAWVTVSQTDTAATSAFPSKRRWRAGNTIPVTTILRGQLADLGNSRSSGHFGAPGLLSRSLGRSLGARLRSGRSAWFRKSWAAASRAMAVAVAAQSIRLSSSPRASLAGAVLSPAWHLSFRTGGRRFGAGRSGEHARSTNYASGAASLRRMSSAVYAIRQSSGEGLVRRQLKGSSGDMASHCVGLATLASRGLKTLIAQQGRDFLGAIGVEVFTYKGIQDVLRSTTSAWRELGIKIRPGYTKQRRLGTDSGDD